MTMEMKFSNVAVLSTVLCTLIMPRFEKFSCNGVQADIDVDII